MMMSVKSDVDEEQGEKDPREKVESNGRISSRPKYCYQCWFAVELEQFKK